MSKKLRKLLSLLLVVSMIMTLFYGCGNSDDDDDDDDDKVKKEDTLDENEQDDLFGGIGFKDENYDEKESATVDKDDAYVEEEDNDESHKTEIKGLDPMNTKDPIELTYAMYEDIEISEALAYEFENLYPNIDVNVMELDVGNYTEELFAMQAVGKLPDCFWILGSPENYITNGLLMDMSRLWEADPESSNVIRGINEYKLGYYGTDFKWATPVKFFPTAAFVNMEVFYRNNVDMPAMDWTWEEFEETVESMTGIDKCYGEYIFGYTGNVSVITWYPIAADKNCIGEFGWNGAEYDMENWAYGMNLEAHWIQNEVKPYDLLNGGMEQISEKYGDNVLYPQDEGYSAINLDYWWNWENYFITDEFILGNKVVFVPYMMPHEDDAQGGNYIAAMDMGGISAFTLYPRETYELLKFMTWGTQGWEYKLEHYPDLLEESTGADRFVSKNNCPITLDEDVWNGFKMWHPNAEEGDTYIVELYGEEYDRSEYFEYFFEEVQNGTWTCYGGQQIPGFSLWLDTIYFDNAGNQNFGYNDAYGIEAACIYGHVDAFDYYEYLQDKGKEIYRDVLSKIEDYLD